MQAVIQGLHSAHALTHLDTFEAAGCNLSDTHAHEWLEEFLPHACSLRKLNLSQNEGIADTGVSTLAKWLPKMPAIQELYVDRTGVSPAGEELIREVQDALGGKLNVLEVRCNDLKLWNLNTASKVNVIIS